MPFIVYGPTCDTLDRLPHLITLPTDIQLGDYIEFGLMGAYTNANRTEFNGFFPNDFVEISAPGRAPARRLGAPAKRSRPPLHDRLDRSFKGPAKGPLMSALASLGGL